MLESLSEKSARPFHRRAFILRRKTTEQKAREAAVFTNAASKGASPDDMTRSYVYTHAHLQLTAHLRSKQAVCARHKHETGDEFAPYQLIGASLEPRLDAIQYLSLLPRIYEGLGVWRQPPTLSIKQLVAFAPPGT